MTQSGIYNINARKCTSGGIYVQYQEDGHAKDVAFMNWLAFVQWFEPLIQQEIADARKALVAKGDAGPRR